MKIFGPKSNLAGLFCISFGQLYETSYYFNIHFLIRKSFWKFGYDEVEYDSVCYKFFDFGPFFSINWVKT